MLDPNFPDVKVFKWKNPNLFYHFEDHYTDDPKLPGIFAGFEINRSNLQEGKRLSFYIYDGSLTEEGFKLYEQTEKGLSGGETVVYGRLMYFLKTYAENVRFGKNVKYEREDSLGIWVYEGKGRVEGQGWEDDESISLNGVQVYKLSGTGILYA